METFAPQMGFGTFRVYVDAEAAANLKAWVWRPLDPYGAAGRVEFWILTPCFPHPKYDDEDPKKFVFSPVAEAGPAAKHYASYAKFYKWVREDGGYGNVTVPDDQIGEELMHSAFVLPRSSLPS